MYVCMYVYMYAWYLRKPEEGVGSLGTGVTDSFEPPYWCWELNPDPLQGQQLLVMTSFDMNS